MKVCKSIFYDIEIQNDKCSITDVCQPLDIATMLQRAQLGILEFPKSSSLPHDLGENSTLEQVDALLEKPASVLDNAFGTDFERAAQERDQLLEIAMQSKKQKQDPDPKPDPKPDPTPDPKPDPIPDPVK